MAAKNSDGEQQAAPPNPAAIKPFSPEPSAVPAGKCEQPELQAYLDNPTQATHDAAAAKLTEMLQGRGVADPSEIVNDAATLHQVLPRLFFGDPDEVVTQVRDLLATGLDGVVVNMMSDGSDPASVRLAGETLTRAFAS